MLKQLSRVFVAVGAVALFATPSLVHAKDGTYKIDPVHSGVVFQIKHFGVGLFHGLITKVTGTVVLKGRKKSSIDIQVHTKSVHTGSKKRDNHLRSPDFFNSKQFPVFTFKSSKVYKLLMGRYRTTGELMINGKKKKIKFFFKVTGKAKDPQGKFRAGGIANLTLNRNDFGITYMPKGLGNKVKLTIYVEAIRQNGKKKK